MCLNELEEIEIKNYLKIESFNFGLMSLGNDVLSMELDGEYLDVFGKSNQVVKDLVVEAVLKLQYTLGDIGNMYGKGDVSHVRVGVCRVLLNRLRRRIRIVRSMIIMRASTIYR